MICNDFHEWRSHEWKSSANHITSDQKIVIHSNKCIILFLTRYFMFWTHSSTKNNHRSLILPSSPTTVFFVLALWRHQSWSVTSRELALWHHIRRLFLHVQISGVDIRRSLRVNIGPVGQISPAAPDQWTTQHGSLVSTDFIWNSKRGEPWFRRNIHEVSQYNWNEWQVASYTKYLKHIWTTKQQVGNQ